MRGLFKKIYRGQRGSVSLMVAVFMVVLIGAAGLTLDAGVYYGEASKLQNALDSAVLAACRELPAEGVSSSAWAAAESEAMTYASLNGFDLDPDDMEPLYKNGGISGIRATKTVSVKYNFARVLGIDSGALTRASAAALSPAGGVVGAVPLCVSEEGLRAAITADATRGLIIKCSTDSSLIGIDPEEASGWFGAVRIDGSGASDYSTLLAYGYSGALTVGAVLDMECGNMSGPTMDGFSTRIAECTDGCTDENYLPDCPRIVCVPVVEVLPSKQVKVVSFAAFFLLECGGSGVNSYIKATYLRDVIVPDSAPGAGGEDFGLYVSRLVE